MATSRDKKITDRIYGDNQRHTLLSGWGRPSASVGNARAAGIKTIIDPSQEFQKLAQELAPVPNVTSRQAAFEKKYSVKDNTASVSASLFYDMVRDPTVFKRLMDCGVRTVNIQALNIQTQFELFETTRTPDPSHSQIPHIDKAPIYKNGIAVAMAGHDQVKVDFGSAGTYGILSIESLTNSLSTHAAQKNDGYIHKASHAPVMRNSLAKIFASTESLVQLTNMIKNRAGMEIAVLNPDIPGPSTIKIGVLYHPDDGISLAESHMLHYSFHQFTERCNQSLNLATKSWINNLYSDAAGYFIQAERGSKIIAVIAHPDTPEIFPASPKIT